MVVGAGLAGLVCAYRLRQAGLDAAVFESRPDRVGGRCFTARGFADGQVAEYGGEFIDTAHLRLRALVAELELELEDRFAADIPRLHDRYLFDGRLVSARAVAEGERAFMRRLRAAGRATNYLGDSPHPGATREAVAFDRRTALEFLEATVPGGAESLLGLALQGYLASEFGLDPAELAATSVLYLLEGNAADEDGSDERFHVAGGNDQVARRLAGRLAPGAVELDAPMEALWHRDDGYGLEIAGVGEVHADQVVLALPFTTLRETDVDDAGLSLLKLEAIRELGMATNAKVLLQFTRRPGEYGRWSGNLATDHPFQYTWDTSLTQDGASGLVTIYSGGADGADLGIPGVYGPAPENVVGETLDVLERAAPGIRTGFNGRALAYDWTADPWARGSYAAFLPGQTVRFATELKRPEGGIHFAGEHTSVAFQGFLEGAVESGERAAREVLAAR